MDNLDRIRGIAENLIGATGPVILELCDRVQNEDIRPLAEAVGTLAEEAARLRAAIIHWNAGLITGEQLLAVAEGRGQVETTD